MTKWARVDLQKDSQILEIIDYNPREVINESFWHLFKECPDNVEKGYWYNPKTDTFYLPEGFAKHPDFETRGYEFVGKRLVDGDGFIILDSAPTDDVSP